MPLLAAPGGFGENVSTLGMTEDDVCLGDRYRLGSALVEVAQGRQPCWKQAHYLSAPSVLTAMVRTGRTGWYYRVIDEGMVEPDDQIDLIDRPLPDWPIARVFALVIGGKHRGEAAALGDLAGLDVLAAGWRLRAARLASG